MPVWYKVDETSEIRVTFLDKGQEKRSGFIKSFLKEGHALLEISAGLQELFAPKDHEYVVSLERPGENYIQETDTFDTWFSSAQWPFSALQALDLKATTGTDNFERFYPTQVMETGYDILPFWVMRMLMMGKYKTGKLPFTDVYLHGLARDQKGQKMSKSKGNVINPLEIIEKYGADALRMALVIRSSAGLDKSVGEPDFKAMRNLGNKIWNASRFVTLLHQGNYSKGGDTKSADQAFEAKLLELTATVTKQLHDFKIGLAAETVYNEFWHWFCDESIEKAKQGELSLTALSKGLLIFLQLLHPFTPFVTEAVWQELQDAPELKKHMHQQVLALSDWPQA
jgi:valyl-tRNA synthetase